MGRWNPSCHKANNNKSRSLTTLNDPPQTKNVASKKPLRKPKSSNPYLKKILISLSNTTNNSLSHSNLCLDLNYKV